MKIMTLDTHSLAEPEYESKLATFARSLIQIKPDIMALQEINQPKSTPSAVFGWLRESGYVPYCAKDLNTVSPYASRAAIRVGNRAPNLTLLLARAGASYQQTWALAEVEYGIYGEGLAAFSRSPILRTSQFYITDIRDYESQKIRKILGINARTEYGDEYLYNVRMGRWNDSEGPFEGQWNRISSGLSPLAEERLWLMGDFNSPAHIAGQGRNPIPTSGWFDAYGPVVSKNSGVTMVNAIDG